MIAEFSLLDFNLSSSGLLRTLEVPAGCLGTKENSLDKISRLFKYALSTIQTPTFSQVKVIYRGFDLSTKYAIKYSAKQFELLREVHKVRDFQLVLYVDVQERHGKHVVQMLNEAVAAEKARGGFDHLFTEPLVTFTPRSFLQTEPEFR